MKEGRIISTRPDYPGYRVVKDLGIIYAFDTEFRMVRTLWQMDEPMEKAFEQLWKKAEKLGANAVLGVSFCVAAQESLPILMGTAVIIEKETEE